MKFKRPHRGNLFLSAILLVILSGRLNARWERERVNLEGQIQDRIEKILSRILPADSYLVSVAVELAANPVKISGQQIINNAFLGKNRFVLPGVPAKKEFSQSEQLFQEESAGSPLMETAVKKISITVLVSPDIGADQIKNLREFIITSIPFDPARGDFLDIHASPLLKSGSKFGISAGGVPVKQGIAGNLLARENLFPTLLLGTLILVLMILVAFLFGPLRRFINRIPAMLPRIGEQAAMFTNARERPTAASPLALTGPFPGAGQNGSAHTEGQFPDLPMPFRFIREEHLGPLSMLLRPLSVPQTAVVLAYLPPAWASRLLATLDPKVQTQVLDELSQGHEIPQHILSEVEVQIKEKLPYVVGGREWLQSVYQLTPPQMQQLLLGTLSKKTPDLARTLRAKTFFFEDLRALDPASLRALVQEAGYAAMGTALKGEARELLDSILRNLAPGIREVITQEMELSQQDDAAVADARAQVVAAGQRLLSENRILLRRAPEAKGSQ